MERTEAERAARGNQAAILLADPIIREALDAMKQQLVDAWAATSAKDTEGRDWLWRQYQVACKFEEQMLSIVNTGKLATISIAEKSLAQRAKQKFFGTHG